MANSSGTIATGGAWVTITSSSRDRIGFSPTPGATYDVECPVGTVVASGCIIPLEVYTDGVTARARSNGGATAYTVFDVADSAGAVTGAGINPANRLVSWFNGPIAGGTIAWVGDSTSWSINNVAQNLNYLNGRYVTEPGSPLYGVNMLWFGSNGNSLDNFLNNLPSGAGIDDLIAALPMTKALVIFSYLINQARFQTLSQSLGVTGMADLVRTAINKIKAARPLCDFVLRIPNSFLTVDVGGYGYVVPNSWAQSGSDMMRDAYLSLEDEWPNVILYNPRKNIFNDTCPASSVHMQDQLHPSLAPLGYGKIIDELVALVGQPAVFNAGIADDAQNAGYVDDFTRYPLVTRRTDDYTLICEGQFSDQGSGFITFDGGLKNLGAFRFGDVVVQNGRAAFTLPLAFSAVAAGANIRFLGLGTGIPTYSQTAGRVAVYRRRYAGISAAKDYVGSAVYPFQIRCQVPAAGNTYIRLQAERGSTDVASVWNVQVGDTLIHPTLGAVVLSSTSLVISSNDTLQLSKTGDYTMPSTAAEVFVVGPARNLAALTLRFSAVGALSNGTRSDVATLGGVIRSIQATLGTAGSSTTTVVIARAGTTVATITFASGATAGTVSWASGSQFSALPGSAFTATITAGTSAADLAVACS